MYLIVSMVTLSQADSGGKDITFTPKNALPVVFSHKRHVIDKGNKCQDCHYQYFLQEGEPYMMNMTKIIKGSFCGRCHNGNKAFDVNDQKSCKRCHGNRTG